MIKRRRVADVCPFVVLHRILMIRSTLQLVFLAAVVVAGSAGLYVYSHYNSHEAQLHQAQVQIDELKQIAQRLQAETRVADVIVTEQTVADGVPQTTLLFVEYAKDGTPLPAKRFCFEGRQAHIDAMVVKFDGKFVADKDPLRGHSVALFTRIFGDRQTPENAAPIDAPDRVPDVYRGAAPGVSDFETKLWSDFWRLADDEPFRKEMGVRVAQGEGVWRPFEPGRLYTLTLDANGGLNIRSEPLKGIYSEALKKKP